MIKSVLFNQIVIIGQNTRTVATTICYFCGPVLDNEQFVCNTIYQLLTYTCLNHLCHRIYNEIYTVWITKSVVFGSFCSSPFGSSRTLI